MEYQIYTTTKDLKKIWKLLKDVGLENLLGTKEIDLENININPVPALNKLIEEGKLDELCCLITRKEIAEFDEVGFPEKEAIIKDFLSVMGNPFKPLMSFLKEQMGKMTSFTKTLEKLNKKIA